MLPSAMRRRIAEAVCSRLGVPLVGDLTLRPGELEVSGSTQAEFVVCDQAIEPAQSWFNRFRRLLIRWDKRVDAYLGFCCLAAVLISYKKVRRRRDLALLG